MATFTRLVSGVREEPLKLSGDSGTCHAMLYRPDSGSSLPGWGIVIVPPDGEERNWALRALVTAARRLAATGFTVLRFDYYGQGESDGNYDEGTVTSRIADVRAADRFLDGLIGKPPVLLGARLGATIALEAIQPEYPRELVLWEPILDTDAYVQQLLRVNVSTQMVTHGRVMVERPQLIEQARSGQSVSVNGFNLTGTLIDGLLALDGIAAVGQTPSAILAVTIGPLDRRVSPKAELTATRVQGPQFWKEPKTHVVAPTPFLLPTIEWLSSNSGRMRQLADVPA